MTLRRRALWLLLASSLAFLAQANAAQTLHLKTLAQRAKTQGKPFVVAVMLSNCPHCRAVKQQHLNALQSDNSVVLVEVVIDSPQRVQVLDETLSAREFAQRHKARFTPTLLFFDAQMRAAAPPLVGFSADFYGHYLGERLAQARKANAL